MKKNITKPLIKYTGGKYKEYEKIKQYFPETVNDYFEPFFGGGGIFFQLHNNKKITGRSHINDLSESLIELYKSIGSENFHNELTKICKAWETAKVFGGQISSKYHERFVALMLDKESSEKFVTLDIENEIEAYSNQENSAYQFHNFSIKDRTVKELNNKLKRFRNKTFKEGENLVEIATENLETAVCQAFYFAIRDMYNDWNNHGHKDNYTMEERSAQWFFIREMCFCSMFRFGSNGDFNIPYGGYSYNSKDLKNKIKNVTSSETINLFKDTDIQQKDFEEIIKGWNYQEGDFMFLDPPYDSTFSEYDDNGFTRADHKRLAECLKNCKCKWLMAIGKTDYIEELYKDFNIVEYDKTYMYQAKGGYDNKHTTHLVITNYPIGAE